MIFKFGKGRKLSDLTKLAEFLEKEGIEYTMETDVQIAVGPSPVPTVSPTVDTDPEAVHITSDAAKARINELGLEKVPVSNFDPAWIAANHDGKDCLDRDCKVVQHYGGIPL